MQNDMHLWCVIDLPFWGRGTTEWWMRFMDGNVLPLAKIYAPMVRDIERLSRTRYKHRSAMP